jgi:dCMP deaminase
MRISRHQMYMDVACAVAKRSTCYRLAVGAVIVINKNIVAFGYNGPPPGEVHCTGITCPSGHCTRAVHAEINALNKMPVHRGYPIDAYLTESPCEECAYELASYGITNVYFLHQYRLTEGIDWLVREGIGVYRMTDSGYVTDYETGELLEDRG